MAATTVGVKLDGETRARLKKLGDARQRSTHWLMKEAIARYLEAEERYELERSRILPDGGATLKPELQFLTRKRPSG